MGPSVKLTPSILACAALLCACGGSSAEKTAQPAVATASSGSRDHIAAANRLCEDIEPKLERTGDRIDAAAKAIQKAPRSARKQLQARSRRAWLDQYDVLAETFAALRELKATGADSAYDTFLAAWAQILSPTESVAEDTGKDQQELESSYAWLQRSVDAFGDAADNAALPACAALFAE
jgi:hypothetical protein